MKKIIVFALLLVFTTTIGFCIEIESYTIDSDLVFAGAEYLGTSDNYDDMIDVCEYLLGEPCDIKMLKKHENVFYKALDIYNVENEEVYIVFMYIKSKNSLDYINKWLVRICKKEYYSYTYTNWLTDFEKISQIVNVYSSSEE